MKKPKPSPGTIAWRDLTISNTEEVRDFYAKVVGWTPEPVDCGAFEDYNMIPEGASVAAAGICHAKGINAKFPPQWLIYIVVDDVDRRAKICRENGGQVLIKPRPIGEGRMCVIRDPAGAVAALYTP